MRPNPLPLDIILEAIVVDLPFLGTHVGKFVKKLDRRLNIGRTNPRNISRIGGVAHFGLQYLTAASFR